MDDIDELTGFYDSALRDLEDVHVPLQIKEMPRRPLLQYATVKIRGCKEIQKMCIYDKYVYILLVYVPICE